MVIGNKYITILVLCKVHDIDIDEHCAEQWMMNTKGGRLKAKLVFSRNEKFNVQFKISSNFPHIFEA